MTVEPIEKRLRECSEEDAKLTARAGKLLRALPEPSPLSDSARRRVLRVLGAPGRNGRGVHLTALHWALLSLLLVSTAAASAKRNWFPNWFQRRAPVIRIAEEPAPLPAPAADTPSRTARVEIEEPAAPAVAAPAQRPRASAAKPDPVRPRLLSDPQGDAIPRVLPKLVYDAQLYSVLLDVCVSAQGRVTKASVVRGEDAALDRQIVEAVERWTYLPGQADGQAAPMCFPLVYRIQVQRE
jgi:TonB family protein